MLASKPWTALDQAALEQGWREKLTYRQLAAKLCRSVRVIQHQMHCGGLCSIKREEYKQLRLIGKRKCRVCGGLFEYKKNRGYCSTCDSSAVHQRITLDKWLTRLVYHAGVRAKRKHTAFDLSLQYVQELWWLQKGLCHYTGIPLTFAMHDGNMSLVSIDRKNSDIGYAAGNVVLCCRAVNIMKSTFTIEELRHWCALVTKGPM